MASNGLRSDRAAAPRGGEPGAVPGRRSPTMSTREAAVALGVSEQAVRQAIARGALAAVRHGRAYRIRPDELDRYAQRRLGLHRTQPQGTIVALPAPVPAPPLPVPATRFVGREEDLPALVTLLANPAERIITLTGPGGVGKTSLALAASRSVADRFPGGVHFVDLAPVTRPRLVLPAIAQSLALREQPGRELPNQLAAFLRGNRLLLVLDNFEQVVEAAPDVAWIVAQAPDLSVLVTSRAPLRIGGERVLPVPPLSLADERADAAALLASGAGRLFVERAREHDPGFAVDEVSAPIVADICARLDGLPLAIELAAAQAKVLPVGHLRQRLEQRLPLLTRGARDAPARLQTMRNAIAWSYDLLGAEEQRLFRRLAVFTGGCTLAAAAAVWGANGGREDDERVADRLVELVGALVDQSLLAPESGPAGEPRFRMLETIREFGHAQLNECEAQAVRAAHARHYLRLAQALRPLTETLATREPIDRLAADDANLAQAITWLDEQDRPADVASMVTSCKVYWYAAGRVSEAERWIMRALPTIDEAAPSDRALLLIAHGELGTVKGDAAGAERVFAEAESSMREVGDPFDLAMGLIAFGAALSYGGKSALAEQRLREAQTIAQAIADPRLRAAIASDALHNLSVAARGQGELNLAGAYSDRALRRLRGHGLPLAEHRVLMTLNGIAKDRGELSQSVAGCQSLLDQISELGEIQIVAAAFAGIAHAAAAWGQFRAAAILVGAVDALRERCGVGLILPAEASQESRDRETLRAAMGDREFEATLAEGHALPLSETFVLAAAVRPSGDALPGSPTAPRQRLTRREREILAMLADSLTDREIGESLFLSLRTVNWHVRAILAKLGAETRRDAVARAEVAGLLPPRTAAIASR